MPARYLQSGDKRPPMQGLLERCQQHTTQVDIRQRGSCIHGPTANKHTRLRSVCRSGDGMPPGFKPTSTSGLETHRSCLRQEGKQPSLLNADSGMSHLSNLPCEILDDLPSAATKVHQPPLLKDE